MMDILSNAAIVIEELQGRCTRLEQKNAELVQENAELKVKPDWFMEQFRLHKHRQFGASSERTDLEQLLFSVFNEAEVEAQPVPDEPKVEITYRRRKQRGYSDTLLKDLPVERIGHRLPEEKLICSCCGGPLHEMSTEIHRSLKRRNTSPVSAGNIFP